MLYNRKHMALSARQEEEQNTQKRPGFRSDLC